MPTFTLVGRVFKIGGDNTTLHLHIIIRMVVRVFKIGGINTQIAQLLKS